MTQNLDRNVWEGWTPRMFIKELEPEIAQIMAGNSFRKILTKEDLKLYCIDNQPYYKKYIPEVVSYFAKKYNLR